MDAWLHAFQSASHNILPYAMRLVEHPSLFVACITPVMHIVRADSIALLLLVLHTCLAFLCVKHNLIRAATCLVALSPLTFWSGETVFSLALVVVLPVGIPFVKEFWELSTRSPLWRKAFADIVKYAGFVIVNMPDAASEASSYAFSVDETSVSTEKFYKDLGASDHGAATEEDHQTLINYYRDIDEASRRNLLERDGSPTSMDDVFDAFLAQPSRSEEPDDSRSEARIGSPSGTTGESPSGQRIGSPSGERVESPSGERIGSPSGERIGSPSGERVESPSGERVELRTPESIVD